MEFFSRLSFKLGRKPAIDYPPNIVVEVKSEEYIYHTPHLREDTLIVYGIHPQPSPGVTYSSNPSSPSSSSSSSNGSATNTAANAPAAGTSGENSVSITTVNHNVPQVSESSYEVIFTREIPGKGSQQLFSLCRAKDFKSASTRLQTFHKIIPVLSGICPNLINVDVLQDICHYLEQYPNQSLAHVAANFSFTDCFKNPVVQKEAAIAICPDTDLTPLHLAVKSGKLNLVQSILSCNPKLDVRDKTGSNVLHFAASTSKDIISLVCSAILSSTPAVAVISPSNEPSSSSSGVNAPSGRSSTPGPGAASSRDQQQQQQQQKASSPVRDDALLLRLINEVNRDNVSPIHLACISDKPDCVKELLKNGANVNGACMQAPSSARSSSSADTPERRGSIRFRSPSSRLPSSSSTNQSNDSSPENNNTGFDKVMIDNLNTKDMKNGGNPLHWVKSPQCMEPLIEMGCNINAKNFSGETVLHVMVQRRQMSCVVTLLSYGAEVNEKGPNGVTPLHLAVKSGDVHVVQALVVFGAQLNLETSSGETARHMVSTSKRNSSTDMILYVLNSVGAKRCSRSVPSSPCTLGCCLSGNFNGVPPETNPFARIMPLYDQLLGQSVVRAAVAEKKKSLCQSPLKSADGEHAMKVDDDEAIPAESMDQDFPERKDIRILSLDGGGIKGLVLIQMLAFLEDFVGQPAHSMFDWIAGTSTGGILALVIASGYTAAQCREFYFKMKNKVFQGTRPYESEPLDSFLKKVFGESCTMADLVKPRVMLTATLADRFPAELHLFRNYESPHEILGENSSLLACHLPDSPKPHEVLIWSAARSSGAAPTYFRPCGRYLDGGLISNNPTLDILTEISYCNAALSATMRSAETVKPSVVLSLGTGAPPSTEITIIDVYRPDTIVGIAKMAFIASSLGQLLVDQASQSDGQVVERARACCSMANLPYFRANPPMSENIAMDETSNQKLINMLWETQAYMHTRKDEFEELRILLQ